jgi:glycosyltransferase involved in cell wall biosynthesis
MIDKLLSLLKNAYIHKREEKDLELIKSSGLFDNAWYLTNNPDVAQAEIDPLLHYLRYGGSEGLDPSPNFSGGWYSSTYSNLMKSEKNPLVHYLRNGRKEGCHPCLNKSNVLTVIVVTYNHEDSIAEALDSILEQETTYPFEIWICEDCSTDGTLAICKDYLNRFPEKIKLFAQPVNTGSDPQKAFHEKTAIKRVNSKYYCILEGDDAWCDNRKIQIALDFMENNPEYITFAHDTLVNDIPHNNQKSLVHEVQKIEIKNPMIFENAIYLHTSSRIHRNVVRFSKNSNIYLDIVLFYLYLDNGPLYYFDKIMSVYNITGKGVWSGLTISETEKINDYLQGKLNQFFDYKYDTFFTDRVVDKKNLELYKKRYGKKLGWEFWIFLKFNENRKIKNSRFKFKQKM